MRGHPRASMVLLVASAWLSACQGGGGTPGGVPSLDPPPAAPGPSPTSSPIPVPSGSPQPNLGREIPAPVWGITLDSVSDVSATLQTLQGFSKVPTARIVFDEGVAASQYVSPVSKIAPVAYVMGEILDSFFVKNVSTPDYLARTSEYLAALGKSVDLWEVGNEINGEWLGDTATVIAKASGAYDRVKAAGGRAALTLYYNQDCWAQADHEMFAWATANLPARMRSGLDYVLISYYEHDCNDLRPDWPAVFRRLAALFPNSRVGFGEMGTDVASEKGDYLTRYYTMASPTPAYVGGYFWWYGRQDMVPRTLPLWSTLNGLMSSAP
jgi:hypothetical protein